MAVSKQELAKNLREAVLKFSRLEAQKKSGIALRTLDNYLSGDTEPKVSAALAIADALGVTVEYLMLRKGPKSWSPGDVLDFLEDNKSIWDQPLIDSKIRQGFENQSKKSVDGLYQALYDKFVSAELDQESSLQELIEVESDSMTPVFSKGDLVVVDKSIKEFTDGGLFALNYMGNQLIRQTQLVPGQGWLLKSSNNEYQDQVVNPEPSNSELVVIGKIISVTKLFN